MELAFGGALAGVAGLCGGWNGWLDLFAAFAPVWLAISIAGALAAWPAVEAGAPRRLTLAAAALGVAANAWLIAPEYLRPVPIAPATAAAPLKLLTFNVWDGNRQPLDTADAIARSGADIVAIQELSGLGLGVQQRLARTYPYEAPCPAGCGVTLLSKRPWTRLGPQTGETTPLAFGDWGETTAPDGGPVEVVTVHYLWPLPTSHPALQRAAVAGFLAAQRRADLILAGDFNLPPWTAALKTQDAALAPLTRRDRALFTYPATIARLDRPAPFPVLPIDHVYAGPAWRTVSVQRLPRAGSDHYGVLVTLVRDRPHP